MAFAEAHCPKSAVFRSPVDDSQIPNSLPPLALVMPWSGTNPRWFVAEMSTTWALCCPVCFSTVFFGCPFRETLSFESKHSTSSDLSWACKCVRAVSQRYVIYASREQQSYFWGFGHWPFSSWDMQLGYHSHLKQSFNQVTLIDRVRQSRGVCGNLHINGLLFTGQTSLSETSSFSLNLSYSDVFLSPRPLPPLLSVQSS